MFSYRRIFSLVIVITMLFACTFTGVPSIAADDIKVTLDGKPIIFEDQAPVSVNSRTLVPMRKIFETLGAEVNWDSETQSVTAVKGDKKIVLIINSLSMAMNDEKKDIDQPAILIGGRTMVPVRFISEALGANVNWDDASQTVLISSVTQVNTPVGMSPKDIPEGGTPLIEKDALLKSDVKIVGPQNGTNEIIPVSGQPFSQALHVKAKASLKDYDYQIKTEKGLGDINAGDILLLSFYARITEGGNVDTGEGQVACTIATLIGANPEIGKITMYPNGEWKWYYYPIEAQQSAQANAYRVSLNFAALSQTVEIGGIELLNYQKRIGLDKFPKKEVTYDGREPDAAWRIEAEKRIEEIRKADVSVIVKDKDGNAVDGADVDVKMLKHEFLFGASMNKLGFDGRNELQKYHKELFNQGLPESETVWNEYDEKGGKEYADAEFKYFKENGMSTRLHVLVWERWDHLPAEVQQLVTDKDKEKLYEAVKKHITDVMTHYKGLVDEYVVENEPVYNSELRKVLGEESIAEWFKIARQVDPNAKLIMNENRLEGGTPSKTEPYIELCKTVTDNGGSFDIVGIQGHASATRPISPESLLEKFDYLAKSTGKKLEITEYDMATRDEKLRADYMRDYMIAVFSHPNMIGFTIWKWWHQKGERTEAVIFDKDFNLRPAGEVYKDLVFNKWWTNASGKTDNMGKYAARGFLGDYEITVTYNGKVQKVKTALKKGQENIVEIVIE